MNKPIFYPVQYGDGSLLYYGVDCPHCGEEINKYNGAYQYDLEDKCEYCGGLLDWSDAYEY